MKLKKSHIKRLVCGVLVCLMLGQTTFASAPKTKAKLVDHVKVKVDKITSKTIPVGKVNKDNGSYDVGGLAVPTYTCENISYILLADLKKVGANVSWDSKAKKAVIYDLDQPVSPNPKFESLPKNATAYLGRDSVYINYQEVPALFVGGRTLIPAKWISLLTQGGENNPFKIIRGSSPVTYVEEEVVEEKLVKVNNAGESQPDEEVVEDIQLNNEIEDSNYTHYEEQTEEIEEIEETDQINHIEEIDGESLNQVEDEEDLEDIETKEETEEDYILERIVTKELVAKKGIRTVKGVNIWFDGKNYIEESYNFHSLQPGEFGFYKDKQYRLKKNYSYVGFIITEVDGITNTNSALHKAWLKNPTYFTVPVPQVNKELFPASIVYGTMKYSVNGFSKGQRVHVARASSGRAYHILNSSGKIVTVPWDSVSIKKSPVTNQSATTNQIENFINSKGISSATNYLVWTDIYRQRTYVFKGYKDNWTLIKNFLSITGKDTTPTPRGLFTLTSRVPSFGSNTYLAKNAYGFIGTTYLYHSLLYNSTGSYLLTNNNTLGHKASSGCIRLSPEDSLWLYRNMPSGTRVYIN